MACITLLSDFGLKDASVAITKGILMQHATLPIIDVSHEIKPYHTPQAAYLLASSYTNFPQGSVHIVFFDLFSEPVPKLILCAHNGHYFLSPDNGLIPLALGTHPEQAWQCFELNPPATFIDWLHETGRIIALLNSKKTIWQQLPPHHFKPPPGHYIPVVKSNIIICEVIHIDQYENVIINITKQLFETAGNGKPFRLEFMQMEEITNISNYYTDVREGHKLCRFNSHGYLEICINRGKAASLFGLRLGGKNNNIKLYFE